ncbi:MAG: DUF2283 domain-containing protein [Nanoarchaeota archaeon]
MKSTTYELHYNEETDFLELYFGESSKCYAEEIEPGVFVRKDQKTREIKSIEILAFKKRGEQILKKILDKINMKLPLGIILEK